MTYTNEELERMKISLGITDDDLYQGRSSLNNLRRVDSVWGEIFVATYFPGEYKHLREIDAKNVYSLHFHGFSPNKVEKVPDLSKYVNLRDLTIARNNLKQMSKVYNLYKLEHLNLLQNSLEELAGLENSVNLKHLGIGQNNIAELNGLDNCVNLEIIYVDFNPLDTLKGLDKLPKLEAVYVSENQIPDNDPYLIKLKNKGVKVKLNGSK